MRVVRPTHAPKFTYSGSHQENGEGGEDGVGNHLGLGAEEGEAEVIV